ncbi:MAG: STAS domain-containing protein [Thermoguttaceae bacterium]|nr:STAS domain-containing protein [Thermoguttaceae bacterium]
MPVSVTFDGKKALVSCEGKFDSTAMPELEKEIQEIPCDDLDEIVVDLAKTDYISSRGIRVVMSLFHQMKGKKFSVVNANSAVKEIFNSTGLNKIVKLD